MNAAVFLAPGAAESERMVETTKKFASVVKSRNTENLRFEYALPGDEHHRSISPYAFTRGLQLSLGRQKGRADKQG